MTKKTVFLALFCLLLPVKFATAADPVRIAVISDINSSYASSTYSEPVLRAIQRIIELHPDLVLISGDMVAGQRTVNVLNELELATMWEGFERLIAQPLRRAGIQILAVPGNHDASAEVKFYRERKAFKRYWRQHQPELQAAAENSSLQWAWKINNLTVIGLDATQHGPLQPIAQRDWLEKTLIENQKSGAEVVLVTGHLPIWAFAKGRESGIMRDVELEKLLHDYRVDAYISGHQHAFYPGIHAGLLQISMGALGSGRRKLIGTKNKSVHSFLLIDISTAGEVSYRVLRGKHYRQELNIQSLPTSILSAEVTMERANIN